MSKSAKESEEEIDKQVIEEFLRGMFEQRKEEIYQAALQVFLCHLNDFFKNEFLMFNQMNLIT